MAKAKAKAAVKRKPAKTQARAAVPRAAKAEKTVGAKAKAASASAAKLTKSAVKASAAARTGKKAPAVTPPREAEPLTLPAAKRVELSVPKPAPAARKIAEAATRADLPPAEGFTLLVDGHYKNSFEDLKGAKDAASELKGRFPMLRVEIYDAAKKIRLPA